jgi:adenine specific DNA methylase Mod
MVFSLFLFEGTNVSFIVRSGLEDEHPVGIGGQTVVRVVEPLPSQTVEVIRPFYAAPNQGALAMPLEDAPQNRLIWTNDNLQALTSLLHGDGVHEPLEGKVDLVYIDPPFAVQSDFKINVEIENGVADEKLPTLIEELAYTDTWKNGLDSYLSMMRDRLELLKALLAPTGSIYVHCDWHAGHYIKVLMDEVFGYENFRSEIIWKRTTSHSDSGSYGSVHDTILFYSRSSAMVFNEVLQAYEADYLEVYYRYVDESGRRFMSDNLTGAGSGPPRAFGDKVISPPPGRHWMFDQAGIDKAVREGRIFWTKNGVPRLKKYADEAKGMRVADVWADAKYRTKIVARIDSLLA